MQDQIDSELGADDAPTDQRHGDRFGIGVPLMMDDAGRRSEGETLDISDSGILFEIAAGAQPEVGARVVLTLAYWLDGEDRRTRCTAEVVRVEQVGSRVNVATRLLSPLPSAQ
jgi:hypothetical protein